MSLARTLLLCLGIGLLTACLPSLASKSDRQGASPINGGQVTTTTLPTPGKAPASLPPLTKPAPAPQPAGVTSPPPPPPLDPLTLDCQSRGGQWANVGQTSFKACVLPTRDGGKQCRAKTDCQGECLARSGSCSPIAPLFGCNDILTEGGLRVSQCIN